MKTTLIARADRTGLSVQTHRIARLINPDVIVLIDSHPFNQNEQFPQMYKGYKINYINGFITDEQAKDICKDTDIVMSCETFYNNRFTDIAAEENTKTVLILNYEFFDWLNPRFTAKLPDKLLTPSYWHLNELEKDWNATYLPTPLFSKDFKRSREANLKRSGKPHYLFINGKQAVHDRNGLQTLYEALKKSKGDFSITIKHQGNIDKCNDPRIIYDDKNPVDETKLYLGYDAMILPRRYSGQSLPTSEALYSGMPVIMLNTSPNNVLLPEEWLIKAKNTGSFMARTMIDVYSGDPIELASKIDEWSNNDKEWWKLQKKLAYDISKNEFSSVKLLPMYEAIMYNK